MTVNSFVSRHIGPDKEDVKEMLKLMGIHSVDQLIDETVPAAIRLKKSPELPAALTEYEYLRYMDQIAAKNKVFKSYIGLGYYNCIVPAVIQRNILENPGWYTAYTPYQAEISQGRLEGLLNFQTMVMDLTGMPIANASLLDEATAAAEAMIMFFNSRSREAVKNECLSFFVSDHCFPQTIEVLKTRAEPLGIQLVIGNHHELPVEEKLFGMLLQYPAGDGAVFDYSETIKQAQTNGIKTLVAADILSLALLKPPGEWGADVVIGSTQRFGVPMGYGGPHAAFFAAKDEFKRNIPGRIIGVSVDREGRKALRMALQTREQHIRRDKATSNICTAQALLAIMAGMYAVYHGPKGIRQIAETVHARANNLAGKLKNIGYIQLNEYFFDTLKIALPAEISTENFRKKAERAGINFRYGDDRTVMISLDETTSEDDSDAILSVFEAFSKEEKNNKRSSKGSPAIPVSLQRTSSYLSHDTFNSYHSETEMMRYLKRLENKDISLTHSMIALGSCTMKLNAASELLPISRSEFAHLHPFVPVDQTLGYMEVITALSEWLCAITGFDAVSLQPNSGAQGEYAGLMVIRDYHKSRGEGHRNIALIPASAHGTNPASAVMAGMKVIVVKCDDQGNIDMADLKLKAENNQSDLAALMVTYPSTHGVFEESIIEINAIIHQYGGQVYMDGANMNAQVGLTNPAVIGADVCHLNLHKTFAIPHGGGGPGMGPIGVKKHLKSFLPGSPLNKSGDNSGAVSAAPFGSALILLISYGYLKMLGKNGLLDSTRTAILNANYLKARITGHYDILYLGNKGHVAHEMILDCRQFKRSAGIEVEDIAKRLIDYGFHAPTVSFPVAGTLMVEPTESESKRELDRFADAMIAIRKEIAEIEAGADARNNVLKNAPHTANILLADDWQHPYSRKKAAYPLPWINEQKYWPPVSRVDNAYGDRNLVCSCPSVDEYTSEVMKEVE